MKIDELIEKEESKGFFSKVKKIFRPRNLLLAGSLIYTALASSCNVLINKNESPVLDYIADIVVNENSLVKIIPIATDPENDPLIFSYSPPLNASGEWQTDYDDSGIYNTTVSVEDGKGGIDSQVVQIIVNDVNRAPVLDPVANITEDETALIQVVLNATDPDLDTLIYSINDPRFVKVSNDTFEWQTDYFDSGIHNFTAEADDQKGGIDNKNFQVTVNDVKSKIVFESFRDGNVEVYVMNPDGTGQTNLTNSPARDGISAWSPDGKKIAFYSTRDGNYEIYVMNPDGTGQTNLTNNPAMDWYPVWSPDGTKIAFRSGRDGNYEVYVMDADGSNQINLTNHPAWDYEPAWSPDGTKIAFRSTRDGTWEIYVMNADGTGQTNLTNNPGGEDDWSVWSPDGTKIAFTSTRDGNFEVYVMDADGSNQTRLTYDAAAGAADLYPAWSPDGSKIVFQSDRAGNKEIYVMNADGTGLTNLTNNPASDKGPYWK